jgi:tetratricopeptide (TPR) repeat protein
MPRVEPGAEAVRRQLDRILQSSGFVRNERLSRFLRFVVESHLEARDQDLKESVLAVQIFGRPPDYDSKRDAVVRTEAGRLRARLSEYYLGEGNGDVLVIELPKGGYVPVFRPRAPVEPPRVVNAAMRGVWVGAGIGVVLLAAVAGRLWMQQRNGPISGYQRYEMSKAYDLYRRARTAYHPGREIADADVDIYQQAIDRDSAFAPGYAGLAAAYAFASSRPIGEGQDRRAKMLAAAQRAIQLDPFLAEGHDAMGVVYARLAEWEKSEQSFRRAIALNPNRSVTRLDYAMNLLLPLGWISNALQQLRIAEKSEPISADVHDVYSYILISAGRFNEAEEHCSRSVTPAECLGRIRIGQGRIEEAIQILTAAPNTRYLGYAYGRAGRRPQAEELAGISPGGLQRALIYAGLGDKDRTFEALEHMAELGPVRVGRALTFPELSLIRGDPRLRALRKKVGLPE